MDDKVFNLLETMYADLSGRIDGMDEELQGIRGSMATKEELQDIRDSMATKHDIVRLENKMDTNHKALFDGYKLTYEKVCSLEKKVDGIDKKVESHDVEIRVIRGAE